MFLRRGASLGACAYSMLQHNWKSCDHRHSHEAQVMSAATLERRELMRHPAANGVWFTSFEVGQHNTNGYRAGWSGILRQSLWPGDTGPPPECRCMSAVKCQIPPPRDTPKKAARPAAMPMSAQLRSRAPSYPSTARPSHEVLAAHSAAGHDVHHYQPLCWALEC